MVEFVRALDKPVHVHVQIKGRQLVLFKIPISTVHGHFNNFPCYFSVHSRTFFPPLNLSLVLNLQKEKNNKVIVMQMTAG